MRRAWRGEGPALDRHSAEASGKTARLACGEWEVAPRPPAATSCSPGAPPHPPAQNRRCHGHTGSHLGTAEAAGGGGGEASGARLGAAGGDPVRAPGRVCGPTQHRVSLLGAGGEPLWDTAMREEGGTRAAPGTRKSQTSEQVRPKQKRKSNNMNMDKTPEHRHDKTLPCEHAAHTHTPSGRRPREGSPGARCLWDSLGKSELGPRGRAGLWRRPRSPAGRRPAPTLVHLGARIAPSRSRC